MVAAVLSGTAMAGQIDIGTPLISGIESTGNGPAESQRDISAPQLRVIWHWLETHQSGWHGAIEPTGEPIELRLELKHTDGRTTSIWVVTSSNGERYLRITGPDAKAYKSFRGLFRAQSATRPLTDREFQGLQKLLGRP